MKMCLERSDFRIVCRYVRFMYLFVFTFPTNKEREVILLLRPANDHCPSGVTAEPLPLSLEKHLLI